MSEDGNYTTSWKFSGKFIEFVILEKWKSYGDVYSKYFSRLISMTDIPIGEMASNIISGKNSV